MISKEEKLRLIEGVKASMAIPFIDDIEDFVWEAIFSHMKGLPFHDPLFNIRSKLLFDVVDSANKIGWSCKTIQRAFSPGCDFELVIQRADIFKKAKDLGFDKLSTSTDCDILGAALMKHWHDKIDNDAKEQNVSKKKIAILLKNDARDSFAFYEDNLETHATRDLVWSWTDTTKTGLQGKLKSDKSCVYRWYPNQKQLFERFALPKSAFVFDVKPVRLPLPELISALLSNLKKR